jgi:hypothetical protein
LGLRQVPLQLSTAVDIDCEKASQHKPTPICKMDKMLRGTLISFSNEAKANVNGTLYRSCIVNIGGENYFAKLWEKSVSKAVIGTEYNIEAVVDGENLWLTCLTGVSATIATPATFAALLAEL